MAGKHITRYLSSSICPRRSPNVGLVTQFFASRKTDDRQSNTELCSGRVRLIDELSILAVVQQRPQCFLLRYCLSASHASVADVPDSTRLKTHTYRNHDHISPSEARRTRRSRSVISRGRTIPGCWVHRAGLYIHTTEEHPASKQRDPSTCCVQGWKANGLY
jgi:hypothetical protein